MRRIPDQRPLLVPEGDVHGKPRLCEATILADPDRRWQGGARVLDGDEIVVTKPGTLLLLAYQKSVDEPRLVVTRSSVARTPSTTAITEFRAGSRGEGTRAWMDRLGLPCPMATLTQ